MEKATVDHARKVLLENVNGLAFAAGACWLYVGLHGVSPDAANIVAGAILMAVGAWPYLRRTYLERGRRP